MNMTDIDFSKAPEGATYRHKTSGLFYKEAKGLFMRFVDGEWSMATVDAYDLPMLEPIPRMHTEYVKDERSINEIAKAMIDGEVFYSFDGEWTYGWNGSDFIQSPPNELDSKTSVIGHYFKKILTPIDERQEFIDAAMAAGKGTNDHESWLGAIYDAGLACKPE